ncbi:sterol desaturase/sphingolipid hydroxylase (fatty acid hydroxylase superfamily) [Fictibacillus halophilus]|uniref:Sterol desaturase/sphingolipid hydroxylase (Fatty acid hydroxylase superfamily) n=1 Tax=Fictibacillus halophilus TaxID=1610490 RepID=A0ABV2LLI3_9BACL|nr:sterol desaturase family protein [Fictibacillus halophilus]
MKSKGMYRDFFFHFDILVMMVIFILIISILFTMNLTTTVLLFFPLGILIYMFSEYLTHRFFFHIKAPKNTFLFKLIKRLHYDHHKKPNELKLLFLPIWYSVPSLFLLSTLLFILTQSVQYTLSFSIGLLFMFFIYEWKHYVAHRPLKPKTRFGRWIKKTHTLHHFKNENYWYGVSTPFIDVLFGTLKDEKDVEWSATAKDLENRSND